MKIGKSKTIDRLLRGKVVGDLIVSYYEPKYPEKLERRALRTLIESGHIKFLRQYTFDDNMARPYSKPVAITERHFEVLSLPKE